MKNEVKTELKEVQGQIEACKYSYALCKGGIILKAGQYIAIEKIVTEFFNELEKETYITKETWLLDIEFLKIPSGLKKQVKTCFYIRYDLILKKAKEKALEEELKYL